MPENEYLEIPENEDELGQLKSNERRLRRSYAVYIGVVSACTSVAIFEATYNKLPITQVAIIAGSAAVATAAIVKSSFVGEELKEAQRNLQEFEDNYPGQQG